MMDPLVLASVVSGFWVLMCVGAVYSATKISSLSKTAPLQPLGGWPSIRIVVAARNEERDIERALKTLLRLDYPHCEIAVVNDRSTDSTGSIIDRLAERDSRLRSLHVKTLPAGWIGKNHALSIGTRDSKAHWILFTDADVRFEPLTLKRAVHLCELKKLDHLTVAPFLNGGSWVLRALHSYFGLMFALVTRPAFADDPKSSAHIGIGAFNMVKQSAYVAVGGHSQISMRPDDDLKLGKIIKQAGFRQSFAAGKDCVELEWYRTIRETTRGLEKNIFAGMEYSLFRFSGFWIFTLLFNIFPFVGVFLFHGAAQRLLLGTVAMILGISAYNGKEAKNAPVAAAIGFPLAALLMGFICTRSVALTMARGGIFWRESFYPLNELKRQHP